MSKHKVEKFDGIDMLGIEMSKLALRYSLEADQPINLMGAPGVGKSAIVSAVAQEMGMAFEPLILSLCDPTDIGGFPVVSGGEVRRLPLGPIRRACDGPVILFLDELTCAAPAVQGAAMRLVYERWAGEVKLHPGTRIIAASNPPEQAAGGWELALPLLGRMTQIKMKPTVKEVQEYFYHLGKEGSDLRNLAVDFAATLEMAPDLLQIDPPGGSQAGGKPWGAPRSWERALKVCERAIAGGEKDTSQVFAAALAGNVGDDQAASFMSIRKVRNQLPSIKEILEKPEGARLPSDINSAVAVIGVLAQVATQNPCPAWIYADRLTGEVRIASMNMLGRFGLKNHAKDPMHKKAHEAQIRLLRGIGEALRAGT